jgi:uncharacterized protein YaiL (DUF2058 family)
MSLQEQLLKAGLVSAGDLKKQEKEARKRLHESKKDKAVATAEANRKAEEQRRLEQGLARKRDHDRQLNREREAEKKLREEKARACQLIASHRLKDTAAAIPYNFIDGSHIRCIRVTPQQQIQLAKGRLGIVRSFDSDYDFPLVPRETALKLADSFPDRVLLLHPESDSRELQEEIEKS